MTSELKKAQNDPNFALELAVGPPLAELVPQKEGSGVSVYKKYVKGEPHRYIMKAAHLSTDDFRIYDFKNGRLVYNAHHPGKNPLNSVDKLGTAHESNRYEKTGEWESYCDVTGHQGFPNFSVRAKKLSRHGRQRIRDNHKNVVMNIGKDSFIKTMSVRGNYTVCRGDDDDVAYKIVGDLMERTLQIVNADGELVAFLQKSAVSLILNATFGAGSEMLIDIAQGVDASTILMIVIGLKQVGQSLWKDGLSNYVMDPFKESVVDTVVESTGPLGEMAVEMNNEATHHANKVVDTGRGRQPIKGAKLPPDMKRINNDYHGLGK